MSDEQKEPLGYTINEDGKIIINEENLQRLTLNYTFNRMRYIESLIDPNKDIYGECGYPKPGTIKATQYKEMFERETGNRVVCLEPNECWKITPCIYEDEDEDVETPFEEAWEDLLENFGGVNFFENKKGSPIYAHLKRADIVSGIGRYGILLLGFDDGLALDQPIPERVAAVEKGIMPTGQVKRRLLYVQCYDETQAAIENYVNDTSNPRNGLPEYYTLNTSETEENTKTINNVKIHWSRVIHITPEKTTSEVFGAPRQEAVFNRLIDLRKLYGGSGEMYYRGAFPGIALTNLPNYSGQIDTEAAKEQLFNYTNSLQRWLAISGIEPKSLSVQVASPKDQIECQLEAICIIKEIPMRIFKGSERGELASSQDKDSWEERVQARRDSHVTPTIIIPFINTLIVCGVLPLPKDSLKVSWDTEKELNAVTASTVVKNYAEAINVYAGGAARSLITPMNFFTKFLKFKKEEAEQLLEDMLDEENNLGGNEEDIPVMGGTTTTTTEDGNNVNDQEDV